MKLLVWTLLLCFIAAASAENCNTTTIDFGLDPNTGNLLPAGTVLGDGHLQPWAPYGIFVNSRPGNNLHWNSTINVLMVFNSSHPTGGDWDLGSPNCWCPGGGPGVGHGGKPGQPGENCVPLHTVLIVSEDGDTEDPDDNGAGGEFLFNFTQPVNLSHIVFLDLDKGEQGRVIAIHENGTYNETLNGLGNNAVVNETLDLNEVTLLRVLLSSSGAIKALVTQDPVCPIPPPPPPPPPPPTDGGSESDDDDDPTAVIVGVTLAAICCCCLLFLLFLLLIGLLSLAGLAYLKKHKGILPQSMADQFDNLPVFGAQQNPTYQPPGGSGSNALYENA